MPGRPSRSLSEGGLSWLPSGWRDEPSTSMDDGQPPPALTRRRSDAGPRSPHHPRSTLKASASLGRKSGGTAATSLEAILSSWELPALGMSRSSSYGHGVALQAGSSMLGYRSSPKGGDPEGAFAQASSPPPFIAWLVQCFPCQQQLAGSALDSRLNGRESMSSYVSDDDWYSEDEDDYDTRR